MVEDNDEKIELQNLGQDEDNNLEDSGVVGCCHLNAHPSNCCKAPRGKYHSFNWLADIPGEFNDYELVEVTFKNTRKGFYRNSTNIPLQIGDIVAVEANPGHDIGTVTLVGSLVKKQVKKANLRPNVEFLRIFRKAKESDLQHFEAAKARETDTMIRSRKIAEELGLNMKIGDVEYQGDGNKAIFYYIADERVDFRQLIKVLADTFKIRIEMKQIGARQEAGRIGGIGPCGRPLCCSSWMSSFVSVATGAARYQDISLNPQKLAGQCAKLKCCLNFEVDTYVEASKQMPQRDILLYTKDSTYYHFKTDIFKREITYSTDKNMPVNLVTIPAARAFEVIALNKQGVKPDMLNPDAAAAKAERKEFGDIIGQDSLTRFDKKKKKKNKNRQGGGGQQQPRNGDAAPRQADRPDAPRQQNGNANGGNGSNRRKAGNNRFRRGDNNSGNNGNRQGNRPPKQSDANNKPADE